MVLSIRDCRSWRNDFTKINDGAGREVNRTASPSDACSFSHCYSGCLNRPSLRGVMMKSKALEWFGVITAILYSMMVALNIGVEFAGFVLLFISAISIGYWAYLGQHKGILFLQFFYATAGVIGMLRWY